MLDKFIITLFEILMAGGLLATVGLLFSICKDTLSKIAVCFLGIGGATMFGAILVAIWR